jgi:hypothetical protein
MVSDIQTYLFFTLIVSLVVSYSISKRELNIFYQKISFMNSSLNEDNLEEFRLLRRSFKQEMVSSYYQMPIIKNKNLMNLDYKKEVDRFFYRKKIIRNIQIVSGALMLMIIVGNVALEL